MYQIVFFIILTSMGFFAKKLFAIYYQLDNAEFKDENNIKKKFYTVATVSNSIVIEQLILQILVLA